MFSEANPKVADVVILGGGIAGLCAAIGAKQKGADKVVILSKQVVGRSGASVMAKGLAAVGPWSFLEDSKEQHYEDTLKAGRFINNPSLVRVLTQLAEMAIVRLERMGFCFDPKEALLYAKPFQGSEGHTHYRHLQLRDITG
ncbi:MAG: FAD-dependent oxidoreductase, partial [Candidatus Methanomethyliaceae archaeon]